MDSNFDSDVRELLDKQQIHETLMRYCRGVDRADRDLVRSCFHPDAFDDHGYYSVSGDEIGDLIVSKVREFSVASMHFIGNELVELHGDVAHSEAYFVAWLVVPIEDQRDAIRVRAGRYIDVFERRGGRWKIARRTVVDEWDRIDPVLERTPGREFFHRGRRGPEDLIYQLQRSAGAK